MAVATIRLYLLPQGITHASTDLDHGNSVCLQNFSDNPRQSPRSAAIPRETVAIPLDEAVSFPTIMPQPLEREMQKYDEELPKLLVDEGKFVLIADGEVIGTYETYADALKVGYEKKKLEPFFVKQIKRIEPLFYFSRPIAPVCLT